MNHDAIYLLFFGTNLTLIVTHLYGWLLKWFYKPDAYDGNFKELFPAHRAVGFTYLLQIFELPYLFQIGKPEALLFVNAFGLLITSLQLYVMCDRYFFPKAAHTIKDYWYYIPSVVVLAPLFLQAVGLVSLPENHRPWVFAIVTVVFLIILWLTVSMVLKIKRAVQEVNENIYADSDDFPVRFAQLVLALPTIVCILQAVNLYANDPWVKFVRDSLIIVANVALCFFTLNPWRKVDIVVKQAINDNEIEADEANAANRVNDALYDELASQLDDLLSKEKIFTEPHITSYTLLQRLGTNSSYLTEVIRRSGYKSFYDMICQHRVRYAISLIHKNPDEKLLNVASTCGFSSAASMTKAFKQQGKDSPSIYRRKTSSGTRSHA